MNSKNVNKNTARLVKDIINHVETVLENYMSEASSTTFYDAAEKADKYNNTALGKRFREYADARREEERHTEFENTLDEYGTIEVNDKKMIVAHYIPTNIDVLVYFRNVSTVAIARVKANALAPVAFDIASDIAGFYERKPVVKDNIPMLSTAFGKDIRTAKSVAKQINDLLGTAISWRYFFGDRTVRDTSRSTVGSYEYLKGFKCGNYKVLISKSTTDQIGYSIYYILIGDEEKSSVLTVYKYGKGIQVLANRRPGSLWQCIKNADTGNAITANLAAPNPKTSNPEKVYDLFTKEFDNRYFRLITDGISQRIDVRIRMEDIEAMYKQYINDTGGNADEITDLSTATSNAEEETDGFMDF